MLHSANNAVDEVEAEIDGKVREYGKHLDDAQGQLHDAVDVRDQALHTARKYVTAAYQVSIGLRVFLIAGSDLKM